MTENTWYSIAKVQFISLTQYKEESIYLYECHNHICASPAWGYSSEKSLLAGVYH